MTPARPALLIQPRDIRWFWQWSPPPLGYLYLAASSPGTVVVDCAQEGRDEREVIDDIQPGIVGVTAFSSTRHAALDVLRYAHEAGAATVIGGPHVSSRRIAEQVLAEYGDFIDYVVRGDGEQAWSRIVSGSQSSRISLDHALDLDALAPPDWSAVPVMDYPARDTGVVNGVDLETTPRISMVFSRGCPGRCRFCSAWKRPMRVHSPDWIERALRPLADLGVRHLCIDDDCWATDEDNAAEISAVLGRLGFVWQATTRADLLSDDLAVIMADNGCYQVCIGLEHGSPRMLSAMNKQLDLTAVLDSRRAAWNAGLRFHALVMQGYPGETERDREEHERFMGLLQPDDWGALGATMILPGTDLYREAIESGAVDDSVWLGSGRHLLASPDGPVMWEER